LPKASRELAIAKKYVVDLRDKLKKLYPVREEL
jgi:hypothetical protein